MYNKLKSAANRMVSNAQSLFLLLYARGWQIAYKYNNRISRLWFEHGWKAGFPVIFALIVASSLAVPMLQDTIEPFLSNNDRIDEIKSLLLTLGGSLIGATAIAFSLIMFAMQVNVERMPHGLFRKFSSDINLLGAFAATFSLATVIACLSLVPNKAWIAGALMASAWCTVLIIIFFLLAYQRALSLISPTKQLVLIVTDTRRNFDKWGRVASRTVPIIRANSRESVGDADIRSKYDMDLVTFFQLHPGWTSVAEQGIAYCVSFSRRYIEQGDYEVSQVALEGIVAINALYIKTKKKTFFPNNYLIINPLSSDSFISSTLEHLRQSVQIGISRKDERQIEQVLRAMARLTAVYLTIDYGDEHATKSHGHLAAGYLSDAVESVVPHGMADVLIEGVTLMGNVAHIILRHKEPEHIALISEKISLIACAGAFNKSYRPVTQVAVTQLAKLTFELIRSDIHDIRFALQEVRSDIKTVAEMYLKIPDTPLASIHSASMASYYSANINTLLSWLTDLVNAVSNTDGEDETAQRIVSHIKTWADELYMTDKDLFLLSIEKKSFLAFDIVHWIVHITKLLLAVSNANACDEHNRDEIRRKARWLIWVLSWVPDNEEAIRFIENYQLTESIFEAAIDAKRRGNDDVALDIRDLLLSWTFKAGKYQTGWGVIERACCGLACLNIIFDLDDSVILNSIREQVERDGSPGLELRFRAAEDIREEAEKYHGGGYSVRVIESAMGHVDQNRLRSLLLQIADQLVPENIPQIQ